MRASDFHGIVNRILHSWPARIVNPIARYDNVVTIT